MLTPFSCDINYPLGATEKSIGEIPMYPLRCYINYRIDATDKSIGEIPMCVYRLVRFDPNFIENHLQYSASKCHIPSEHTSDLAFRLLCDKTFGRALDIELRLYLMFTSFITFGSCNGLLCLANTSSSGTKIYICNPSIIKHRTVNFPIIDFIIGLSFSDHINIALGFGYKEETDDYNIIMISLSPLEKDVKKNYIDFKTLNNIKIEVYMLMANLWKDIEVDYFPWELFDATHSKAIYRDTYEEITAISALLIGEEFFRPLSSPDYLCDGEDLMEYGGVYKDNLSLFVFHFLEQDLWDEKCYLWVMRDYNVEGSWAKVYMSRLGESDMKF